MASRRTDGIEEAWADGLGSVLDRIVPNTGRVIVLGDMAYPAQGGIDCLTAHEDDVMACSTPVSDAVYADHNAMERQVAEEHGAEYVNTIPWFCTSDTCPAVIGGLTTRRDAHHVSENYAHWLSVALGEETGLLNPDESSPEPAVKDPVALIDQRRAATLVQTSVRGTPMTTYIALLRGINIGKNKRIKMEPLRELVTDLGFTDVRTLVNSGNVVFSGDGTTDDIARQIEAALSEHHNLDVAVVVRTAAEMQEVVAREPISGDSGHPETAPRVIPRCAAPRRCP